jgi:hypothetical protein
MEAKHAAALTQGQKIIGVCLLLFYLAMIGVTVATLPYVTNLKTEPFSKEAAAHSDYWAVISACANE